MMESDTITNAIGDDDIPRNEFSSMELCSHIPKSSIVYDTQHDIKWKATKLYEKYICVSSEYEINVNGRIRAGLTQKFHVSSGISLRKRFSISKDKRENDDLVVYPSIFDECCEEMGKLLGYSLSRFRTKPQYKKLSNFETENENME